jgi:hypothetical protein
MSLDYWGGSLELKAVNVPQLWRDVRHAEPGQYGGDSGGTVS